MSIDLAVWEGLQPSSDEEATRTFQNLYETAVESPESTPPTPAITEYVSTLLARYPDLPELDDDAVSDSPWADGPLAGNASGPFLYLSFVTNEAAEEAFPYAVDIAHSRGLVAYDPQAESLK